MGKIKIYGGILDTRFFGEFWDFSTQENEGTCLQLSAHWLAGGAGPKPRDRTGIFMIDRTDKECEAN